jgi:hypothetical protein
LAALFLLLSTALTAFAGIFVEHQPSIATAPHFIRYFVLAISAFYAIPRRLGNSDGNRHPTPMLMGPLLILIIALAVLPWYQRQFSLYMTQLIPAMPNNARSASGLFVIWLFNPHQAAFEPPQPPPPMLEA